MKHVSILLPSYNYAHLLDETIGSVLKQTHRAWELLIIDDGSKDRSVEVARGYAQKDARICVLEHPDKANHGLAATLRYGLSSAKHSIVAFLEADDLLMAESLEKRLQMFCLPDTALVFSATEFLIEGKRNTRALDEGCAILDSVVASRKPSRLFAHELMAINLIPTFSCVMANRNFLLSCDFNAPFAPALDKWLWQQMALLGVCRYVNIPLTRWRLHTASYMNTVERSGNCEDRAVWFKKTVNVLQHTNIDSVEHALALRIALAFPRIFTPYTRFLLKFRAIGCKFVWKLLYRKCRKLIGLLHL